MVFAIGWSSVSIASVNTMQISMQHGQMQNSSGVSSVGHRQMMQNMSVQEMKNHCMEVQQNLEQHSPHSNHDQKMQNLKDCHIELIQAKKSQHTHCQDCVLFSCQSSIVWFNNDIPKLIAPEHSQNILIHQMTYQAQHLAGYWQEILRPPKA